MLLEKDLHVFVFEPPMIVVCKRMYPCTSMFFFPHPTPFVRWCMRPGLRPADILSSAVSECRDVALDVSVASPDAAHAGADCTESARRRKRRTYLNFFAGA